MEFICLPFSCASIWKKNLDPHLPSTICCNSSYNKHGKINVHDDWELDNLFAYLHFSKIHLLPQFCSEGSQNVTWNLVHKCSIIISSQFFSFGCAFQAQLQIDHYFQIRVCQFKHYLKFLGAPVQPFFYLFWSSILQCKHCRSFFFRIKLFALILMKVQAATNNINNFLILIFIIQFFPTNINVPHLE